MEKITPEFREHEEERLLQKVRNKSPEQKEHYLEKVANRYFKELYVGCPFSKFCDDYGEAVDYCAVHYHECVSYQFYIK